MTMTMTTNFSAARPTVRGTMLVSPAPSRIATLADRTAGATSDLIEQINRLLADTTAASARARSDDSLTVVLAPSVEPMVVGRAVWVTAGTYDLAGDMVTPPQARAVDVIIQLTERTGLPQEALWKAAGVARRTFYSWMRKPDTQPRMHSLGRLWSVAQCVDDIDAITGSATWVATPERRALLEAGRFDELVDLATAWVRRATPAIPTVGYAADDRILHESARPVAAGGSRRLEHDG